MKYIFLLFFAGCLLIPVMACKKNKNPPVPMGSSPDTRVEIIITNTSKTFQTMEGFGGFRAQDVYWGGGPFTSPVLWMILSTTWV